MPCNLIHYFFLRHYVTVPAPTTVRITLLYGKKQANIFHFFRAFRYALVLPPSPLSPLDEAKHTFVYFLYSAIQTFFTLHAPREREDERMHVCGRIYMSSASPKASTRQCESYWPLGRQISDHAKRVMYALEGLAIKPLGVLVKRVSNERLQLRYQPRSFRSAYCW